jgi:superfamily II DNA or RNA helicase
VRLRPYQTEAIDRVDAAVARSVRRVLVVAPTGAGKTTIAAFIILRAIARTERVLFLAHRRELIVQAWRRLLELGLTREHVGIVMADDARRRPTALVQVASVDTLRRRTRPPADLVFVDESHRALAASYRAIAADYPKALHLGLTATPYRADGKGLGDAYDELVVVASPQQLIAEGYLVEPRVFTVPAGQRPDLSRVSVTRGDYSASQLAEAVDRHGLVGNIVDHWTTHARGVRTVAFAASVEHSQHIAARFREAGVAAEHLDGETQAADRDAILSRLDRGETLVVSNCGVLCEGWDQPAVKCAILARPTKSTGLYLQQAGRILRPWDDQAAIILDHAGCALEHGLPQDDRPFCLDGRKRRAARGDRDEPLARECPRCFAVLPLTARVCPECGHAFAPTRELPVEQPGELVAATTDDVQRAAWDELCRRALAQGHKPGWVFHRFRERFGAAPPPHYRLPDALRRDERAVLDAVRDAARGRKGSLSWATLDAARGGAS